MKAPLALVVAKAPVPGQAKTRLGAVVGPERAAGLAAAALLDTLGACVAAFGVERCHLSLAGDLATASRGEELVAATRGWTIHEQVGDGFAERLRRAHEDAAGAGEVRTATPVIQVGMDTPQLEARHLHDVAALLHGPDDAVLGPAEDGGWWLLGVGSPALVEHLADVPMSTQETGHFTRIALEKAGAAVQETVTLRDVDEVEDAEHVAAAAPDTLFARSWSAR